MSRKTLVIIVAVVISGAFFVVYFISERDSSDSLFNNQDTDDELTEQKGQANKVETPALGEVTQQPSGDKQYVSEAYGFSFLVPSDFTVGEFDEAGGRLVLAQSGEGEQAFQIFITPWDEPEDALTPERIKQDLPDLEMQDVGTLSMTGGRKAVTFISSDPSFGQTREVWFVYDGHLYQIITYAGAQDFLAQVLETWSFTP